MSPSTSHFKSRSFAMHCRLSQTNSDFPKYPPQPVVRCSGYRPTDETEQDRQDDSRGRHG